MFVENQVIMHLHLDFAKIDNSPKSKDDKANRDDILLTLK